MCKKLLNMLTKFVGSSIDAASFKFYKFQCFFHDLDFWHCNKTCNLTKVHNDYLPRSFP